MSNLKASLLGILVLLCGFMTFANFEDYIAAFHTTVDFNELTVDEVEANMRVEGEVYAVLDQFANEETWTESKTGVKSGKKTSHQYYIIPVGDAEYMGLSASPDDFKKFDQLMDATYDYIMDPEAEYIDADSIPFVGKTTKMSDELYRYFTEWFQESEYLNTTEMAVIETYVVPVMLETRNWTVIYVMLVINVVLLLILILWIVLAVRKHQKNKSAPGTPVELPYTAVPNGPAGGPVNPTNYAAPGAPTGAAPYTPAPGAAPVQPTGGYDTPDHPDGSRKGGQNTPDQP